MRVADLPDLASLADAIASSEHTAVESDDLAASHAHVPELTAGEGQPGGAGRDIEEER